MQKDRRRTTVDALAGAAVAETLDRMRRRRPGEAAADRSLPDRTGQRVDRTEAALAGADGPDAPDP